MSDTSSEPQASEVFQSNHAVSYWYEKTDRNKRTVFLYWAANFSQSANYFIRTCVRVFTPVLCGFSWMVRSSQSLLKFSTSSPMSSHNLRAFSNTFRSLVTVPLSSMKQKWLLHFSCAKLAFAFEVFQCASNSISQNIKWGCLGQSSKSTFSWLATRT